MLQTFFLAFSSIQGVTLCKNCKEGNDTFEGELPVWGQKQSGGRRCNYREDYCTDKHLEHRPKTARDANAAKHGDDQRVELEPGRPARHAGL